MFENQGHWIVLTYRYPNGAGRRFLSSADAGTWANKTFGCGQWTLEWIPAK